MLLCSFVEQRISFNALKFIHRIEIGNVPGVLTDKIITWNELYKCSFRSDDTFHLPSAKQSSTQNCLLYKGLKTSIGFRAKYGSEWTF